MSSEITIRHRWTAKPCWVGEATNTRDAIAKGIEQKGKGWNGKPTWNVYGLEQLGQVTSSPVWSYERLWGTINTTPGIRWKDDPWVWTISFRRIKQGEVK